MRQFKITNSITNRDGTTVERYFTEVSKQPLLTPEEEVALVKRIKQGDQNALEKLVKGNLRFVISVAKKFQYAKVPFCDLINEGNIGLIKAAKMFDETRGFKFISYAVWWIRQSIMKALEDHSRVVRIPVNKVRDLSKINKAATAMEQELEREPSSEELAEFLNVSIKDIENIQNVSIKQISLDAPFEEGESNCLLDIFNNPNADPTDESLDRRDSLSTEMKRLLAVLTSQEGEIISKYFGIGCENSYSLEELGEELGLSKERVRQIKNTALKKLRLGLNAKLLIPYLD